MVLLQDWQHTCWEDLQIQHYQHDEAGLALQSRYAPCCLFRARGEKNWEGVVPWGERHLLLLEFYEKKECWVLLHTHIQHAVRS